MEEMNQCSMQMLIVCEIWTNANQPHYYFSSFMVVQLCGTNVDCN